MITQDIQKILRTKEEFKVLLERPFNTLYASDTLVVKIAKPQKFKWQVGKFTREKRFFNYVRGNVPELKVPEIILVDESKKRIPYDFMVMRKIGGISLWNFVNQTSQKTDLLQKLGRAIAKIHSINLDEQEYGLLNNNNYGSWVAYLSSNFSVLEEILLDREKPEWLLKAKKIIVERLQEIKAPKSLLHNDLNLGNFIMNPNNPEDLQIIDGEVACVGDPMYELGRFNLYTPQIKIIEEFKRGYSKIRGISEQYIDLYTVATGLEMFYLFNKDNKRIGAFNKKIEESLDRISR